MLPPLLEDFFHTSIAVSGVLFGLFFTAFVFILQNSFNKLVVMRQTFHELYQRYGLFLLIALSYTTLTPLLVITEKETLALLSSYLFLLAILVSGLKFLRFQGEFITIFSHKSIPESLGPLSKFVRSVKNNGVYGIRYLAFFAILFYPLFTYRSDVFAFQYNPEYLFNSVLFVLCFAILTVPFLLYEAFFIQKQFMEMDYTSADPERDSETWDEEKAGKEKEFLLRQLKETRWQEGHSQSTDIGTFLVHYIAHKNAELWCNINLDKLKIDNRKELQDWIQNTIKNLSVELANKKSDFNTFALSFHFYLSGKKKNAFIRLRKADVLENQTRPAESFFEFAQDKIIDETLR